VEVQRIPHSTKGGSGGWLHSLIRELPGAAEVGQRIVREALTELAGPPQRVSPA